MQFDYGGLVEYARSAVLFVDKAPHEWLFPRRARGGGIGAVTQTSLDLVLKREKNNWFLRGSWGVRSMLICVFTK